VGNLFELAHSWGYPHPDMMLSQMTARQYLEMIAYLNYVSDKAERQQALAAETRLREFMEERASAAQMKNG